jgi:hypothetical protein
LPFQGEKRIDYFAQGVAVGLKLSVLSGRFENRIVFLLKFVIFIASF